MVICISGFRDHKKVYFFSVRRHSVNQVLFWRMLGKQTTDGDVVLCCWPSY